jgi:hypothetical protein
MPLTLAHDPTITQNDLFRFRVQYPGKDPLDINFEPLWLAARELVRCDRMVLLHWQGKPQGLRRFGAWEWQKREGESSRYLAYYDARLSGAMHYALQIEDNVLPCAALFYPGARITPEGRIF